MFIQTESTPNPSTLKFVPGVVLSGDGSYDFKDMSEAVLSPLATRLFSIEGVQRVFVGTDFLSVTKNDATPWNVLKPLLLGAIMDHLVGNHPVILKSEEASRSNQRLIPGSEGDPVSPIVMQIRELLDTRIRPAVAMDGGDVAFVKFEDGIVYLDMQGACAGCPSSSMTLKVGIENMLKHYVPEVLEVRPYEG